MPVYELIAGQHIHGSDADGNRRVFRAANYPALTPGGPVPGGGDRDPLWKEGDQYVKTNRKFRVVNKGRVSHLSLDQLHPNKFREVDPNPVPEDEEMLFSLVQATCKKCDASGVGLGTKFKVHDRLMGKTVACPNCKEPVQVALTKAPHAMVVSQELRQPPKQQSQQQGKQEDKGGNGR